MTVNRLSFEAFYYGRLDSKVQRGTVISRPLRFARSQGPLVTV